MSTRIFISAHKDFKLNDITSSNTSSNISYNIISGKGDLKDAYGVPVIEEDWKLQSEQKWVDMHDSYAELTRLFYIYKHIVPKDQYIGFCQYKRRFFIDKPVDEIFKEHDAILPKIAMQMPSIKKAYGFYHRKEDIEAIEDAVKKKFPHFSNALDEAFNKTTRLHPHNSFIMKNKDFNDYAYFIYEVMRELDKNKGWRSMSDEKADGVKQLKNHAFLAERLSEVFYKERFKNPVELPFVTCY
jgi:hypothetical protein